MPDLAVQGSPGPTVSVVWPFGVTPTECRQVARWCLTQPGRARTRQRSEANTFLSQARLFHKTRVKNGNEPQACKEPPRLHVIGPGRVPASATGWFRPPPLWRGKAWLPPAIRLARRQLAALPRLLPLPARPVRGGREPPLTSTSWGVVYLTLGNESDW